MNINIVPCIFVLDTKKSDNIRKNNIQELNILVNDKGMLPGCKYTNGDLKDNVRSYLNELIGTNKEHIEQVYTFNNDNSIDIVYLVCLNSERIKKIKDGYKLIKIKIENNKNIIYGDNIYKYNTLEDKIGNNIEYRHVIKDVDDYLNDSLIKILTCYKKIRSNIDNTDIIFKFMSKYYSLEDVRNVYEYIKDVSVDKSNFRKKIIKYCDKIDMMDDKNGYRPTQLYTFKLLEGDKWI